MIDDDTLRDRRPRSTLPWLAATGLAMFAVGMIASPWFETNVRSRLPGALHQPDVGAIAARIEGQKGDITALDTRVSALEARPAAAAPAADGPPALNDPAAPVAPAAAGSMAPLEARVAAVERGAAQQGTRVDNLSAEIASLNTRLGALSANTADATAAAAKSAEKARGVLLVTAARRAAEQGQSLAVLEPALRRYFGAENAPAVDRLLSASLAAPTLDELRRRFTALRPGLLDGATARAGDGWWDRLTAGIGSIVAIRRTTNDGNARRIDEAARRLTRGDVAGALVILGRLPPAMQRALRGWRADAEAHAAVFGALQQLEATVLLEDADLPLAVPPAKRAADTL